MTTTEAIREMMENWDRLMRDAAIRMPSATAEERYQACKQAFDKSLGLSAR